ncbi:MAG: xylan 1,4-beta-xylosidase, partial [Novibacillus thermophilus]
PRFPSHSMVDTLRQAAQPLMRTARAKSEAGFVTLDVTLTKNEVTLIEIVPVRDETDSYVGLDDALITSY